MRKSNPGHRPGTRFRLALLTAFAAALAVAAFLGAPGTREVHADGPTNGTFNFGQATYPVAEGGTAYIVVNRSQGTAGTQTVQYSLTFNGTATAGDLNGFAPSPGFLTFNPGETSKTIDAGAPGSGISTFDDALNEGTETVTLALTSVFGGGVVGATQPSTTLSITDNDSPGISVSPTSGLQTTEAGGQASFTVVLNTQPSASVTVGISSNDTTEGTVSAGSLTFTTGNWSTPQNVTITGVDDALVDGNIAYTIVTAPATSADGGYNGLDPADVSVTNIDNDGPGTLQFTSATYSVSESGGTALVSVSRTGGTAGAASVQCNTVAGGTASAGVDYTTVTAQVLSWIAGEGGSKNCSIPILTDVAVESNETVNLTLSGVTGATPGAQTTAILTILDDDGATGQFQFSATNYNVAENAGSVLVTVNRINGSTGTASVSYATSPGTAIPGSDYTSTSGTLTFLNGETVKTFSVTIIDDAISEVSETVSLALSGPTGGASLTAPSTATVTILDNETAIPVITSLTPATGPTGGTTYVTISGANFTGTTSVTFGGTDAPFYTVVNSTTIAVYTPAHAAGVVEVRVTNAAGTSANAGTADDFTYTGTGPVVSAISPTSGPTTGGTTVTITGSGFTGATSVTFGGTAATFTVNNSTSITATSPAHSSGTVDVIVTTPAGSSPNTSADNFTYTSVSAHHTYVLSFQWNLLVWFGASGASVENALKGWESVDDTQTNNVFSLVTAVYRWNAILQQWLAFFPSAVGTPGANDFTTFDRYVAYWVAVVSGANWTIATP
ncbi:MAG: IPT/TIG domain-containing protein [Thermoflexaceae bacterium]|nr:IPT/TIG domain-containing protein [Thermoflexaceae bacterium]